MRRGTGLGRGRDTPNGASRGGWGTKRATARLAERARIQHPDPWQIDAVQLPPDAPPVAGTEALPAVWDFMANTEGLEVSWEPTFARVSPDGNMAYDYGTASMTLPDGAVQSMKYLVVWVREDGEWKVAADMFNANEAY
jgi:hypothetical protein